jgi:hypothetical protein
MTSYYLAAAFARQAEIRQRRAELLAALPTAAVTSRWLDETASEANALDRLDTDPASVWPHAREDLHDAIRADVVISFTGSGATGGRHVEFGYALALGKRLALVGPRENVFHACPVVERYADWEVFLKAEAER